MGKLAPLFLLLLYIVPRFVFHHWFNGLPGFTGYYWEAGYCALVMLIYRRELRLRFPLQLRSYLVLLSQFTLGALAFGFVKIKALPLPWDFSDSTTVLLLLFIAPVLEECIFRQALWVPLTRIFQNRFAVLAATSVLFSLGHALAWFYVPPEYKNFILYQTIYTLVIACWWGWERLRTGSLLFVILLHVLFNFGFWATERLTAKQVVKDTVVLVIDMPVLPDLVLAFRPTFQFLGAENFVSPAETLGADCKKAVAEVEGIFTGTSTRFDPARVRLTAEAVHGYHLLGVLSGANRPFALFHFGMGGAPDYKKLPPDAYIEKVIDREFAALRAVLTRVSPDYVLIAASESIAENFADLRRAGYPAGMAELHARKIVKHWADRWSELLRKYSRTQFIVAAGNGGIDSVGDAFRPGELMETTPIPAALDFPNLVNVGSLSSAGAMSGFSNRSANSRWAPGELVRSWAPCGERPEVRLSGTSQAAAVHLRDLLSVN